MFFLFFSLTLVKAETPFSQNRLESANSVRARQEMSATESRQMLKKIGDSLPDMSDSSSFDKIPTNLKESEVDLVFFKKSGLIYPEKTVSCSAGKYVLRLKTIGLTDKASLTCVPETFKNISNSFLEYYSNHGWEVYNESPKTRNSRKYLRAVLKKGHIEFLATISEEIPDSKNSAITSFLFQRYTLVSQISLLEFIKKTK